MINDPNRSRSMDAHGKINGVALHAPERVSMLLEVARRLEVIDLAKWTHPLLVFLRTYEGIEQFVGDDDPIRALFQLTEQYMARKGLVHSGTVGIDVANLAVVYYQAAWLDSKSGSEPVIWNPLAMTFREFQAMSLVGDELRVWKDTEPNPDDERLRGNLVADYVKVNGFS